jgi:hypothetical protein
MRQPAKMRCPWILLLILCVPVLASAAERAEQSCPVHIGHIELTYNHAGGQSKPQLSLMFDNTATKRIVSATFALLVLDANGYPRPYDDPFIDTTELDSGKTRLKTWELAPEKVDIHRTGETVILQSVEFDDRSKWEDDGTETCSLTVDYHPK